MNEDDYIYLAAAAHEIEKLFNTGRARLLYPGGLSPDLQTFGERFDQLMETLETLRSFTITLANGDINSPAPWGTRLLDPLKHLQANLRHLIWQTQQVTEGDLNQHVDFMGEFSASFNQLIQLLRHRRSIEEKVHYLSMHDSLTGLYNRTFFNEELEQLSSLQVYPVTFVIADVDGLKAVNDTAGHQVGDLLIQKASQVLQQGVRAADVLARIGGDEFAIILRSADETIAISILARIRAQLDAYNQKNHLLPLSLSLGNGTANSPQELQEALQRADEAMYRDKMEKKERPS
jgi:diguanylate cyclase (GGDEF)-like protein